MSEDWEEASCQGQVAEGMGNLAFPCLGRVGWLLRQTWWLLSIPSAKDRQKAPLFVQIDCLIGLPGWLNGKESACQVGDADSIPESGRFPGIRHGNPLQYSCLENPMDKGAGRLQSIGPLRDRHDWSYSARTHSHMQPKEKRGESFKCERALSYFLFSDFFPPILSSVLLLRTLLAV